ncbi:FAD-binding oxidoreductase [Kiloniella laminariae]|uniref:FAD-binding oxidoreductase n=1 Tax=Kiloniella laminariae TaxID=454162 RepID=A0ABT4LNX6_9PROT|nr:FAD-binding oxidoreductase [Kiloniella laminariae]MCZ4282845.1 FAD-binding oxidoreductase [Kiloniella laminariae]
MAPSSTPVSLPALPDGFLPALKRIVGDRGLLTKAEGILPHVTEQRGRFVGATACVVKPGTTGEVAQVIKLCQDHDIAIVPQGGNTGLVSAGIAFAEDRAIILNLSRMNKVRNLDPLNNTMTVEAGCILQNIQEAAAKADRFFPLSLGSEGSCQIGGNIASNAGGINVIRYGNTRALVLGLEVVTADGEIWDGLRSLRKDNTGYDLKQLFIGSEGTLGVITAAVLKLFPAMKERSTAFIGLRQLDDAPPLLGLAQSLIGEALNSFELIPRIALDFALKHGQDITDPLGQPYDWYILLEASAGTPQANLPLLFESFLEQALEAGLIHDAALAQNTAQADSFWRLRENITLCQKAEGGSIKHDIAVPLSAIPAFISKANAAVESYLPGIRPYPFGHIGDGNIHYNLSQPPGMDINDYLAHWDRLNRIVHDIVVDMGGSISAEHGIGRVKLEENLHYKSPLEIRMMQQIKQSLDPKNLMNPGKLLPVSPRS